MSEKAPPYSHESAPAYPQDADDIYDSNYHDEKEYMTAEEEKEYLRQQKENVPENYPPEYISSSSYNNVLQWDFRYYGEFLSRDIKVFNSKDAHDKYKSLKKPSPNTPQYEHTISLQQQGFGLPLLRCEQNNLIGRSMTVYKYRPPPRDEVRLFNVKVDRYVYCQIIPKSIRPSYNTYEFRFTPDPYDQSKNFSLTMVIHNRYPIADFSPYKGRRMRWTNDSTSSIPFQRWKYSLNFLGDNQTSLTDDMESDGKVNSSNPLLGNVWKNVLIPRRFSSASEFYGVARAGELVEIYNVRRSQFLYKEIRPASSDHPESINAVSDDALVFLCITCYFKRIEDIKEAQRRSRRSSGGGGGF